MTDLQFIRRVEEKINGFVCRFNNISYHIICDQEIFREPFLMKKRGQEIFIKMSDSKLQVG